MKIAFVNTWRGGAVNNVTQPMVEWLNKLGHEVEMFYIREIELMPSFDKTFYEFDMVHFSYFMNANNFMADIEVPFTIGVHHMPAKYADSYCTMIRQWGPSGVVVPEIFVQRQLGQRGIYNSHLIPYTFDHTNYPLMGLPEEFAVGYLGCDYNLKRFKVIEDACKRAGVKCVGFGRDTTNEEEGYVEQEKITEFFKSISCYAVASFDDGGPLPPQEALLCGRPVITTPVGMMPTVVKNGHNGMFHNGTVRDLAEKIKGMKEEVEQYHQNILLNSNVPNVEDYVYEWEAFFKKVLDE